jgi:hypothetical protein
MSDPLWYRMCVFPAEELLRNAHPFQPQPVQRNIIDVRRVF